MVIIMQSSFLAPQAVRTVRRLELDLAAVSFSELNLPRSRVSREQADVIYSYSST